MNKLFPIFVLWICVQTISYGQTIKSVNKIPNQQIDLISGNPKSFKNAKSFHIKFDYSGLKIGGHGDEQTYIEYMKDDAEKRKKSGSEWEKKWHSHKSEVFQPKFIATFHKHSREKIKVDSILKNQNFVLTVHTKFIEIGFNRNFEKSPTYINAKVIISNHSNSEESLIISMSYIIGNEVFSSYSADFRRIEEAYAKCGKELAKYMRKVIY